MGKKRTAIFMALILLLSLCFGQTAWADTDAEESQPEGYVVMSVEKLTLGQGFILEPQYIPYYHGENLAQVTDRALQSYANRSYLNTGTLTDGFYLSDIYDPDRGSIENTMPQYIKDLASALVENQGFRELQYEDTNDSEYLGEFDYFSQSGWMYSVQNSFPPVGAAGVQAQDGMVVRWQFTLVGLGADLGNTGITVGETYKGAMDKTELFTVLAAVRNRPDLLERPEVADAWQNGMKLAADMTAQKEAAVSDLSVLKLALGLNSIESISLPEGIASEHEVAFGTSLEALQEYFPNWLAASIDGKAVNLTGITWECSYYTPDISGLYTFYPVLPETYKNYTVESGLPGISVTVQSLPGDINGDGKADLQDVSRMAASMGNAERTFCDLNGDGAVNIRDFLLLLQQIFG